MSKISSSMEAEVRQRYSEASQNTEADLCCATTYNPSLLAAIPDEVIERDYGCGNPTEYLHGGDTVLDLGSGAGKICFIASQIVGPQGRVIGIDMNDDMLAVARKHAPAVASKIGYSNVEFRKGRIQDLALDLEVLDSLLAERPISSASELAGLESDLKRIRSERPLVADGSVDVVVSNCVLNLVDAADKPNLFAEIFRVLRRGGRAIISDIVSDEEVPQRLQQDAELWTGCISGALREDLFLKAFEDAGFYGITILERQGKPWRTVNGIEFRSVTVAAYKGKQGACWDRNQAVIYRGPFKQVEDDDGHILRRGVTVAVCEKTFNLYSREPYRDHVELVHPRVEVRAEDARSFPCAKGMLVRDPRQLKGADFDLTTEAAAVCGNGNGNGNGNGSCC